MISRRSIRTKSFQVIYSQAFSEQDNIGPEAVDFFKKTVERVYFVYFFNIALAIKGAKLLQEKNILAESTLPTFAELKSLLTKSSSSPNPNGSLLLAMKDFLAQFPVLEKQMNEYLERVPNRAAELKFDNPTAFYKWLQTDAEYNEMFSEMMLNGPGSDDYSIITGTMRKTVKAFPALTELEATIASDDETAIAFGELLVANYFRDDHFYNNQIELNSRNWEIDRVALIDRILIKMGLVEMASFPSIPVNVTINEFIEISKVFSLDKSKEFINGLLDKISRKLIKDGKITKDEAAMPTEPA